MDAWIVHIITFFGRMSLSFTPLLPLVPLEMNTRVSLVLSDDLFIFVAVDDKQNKPISVLATHFLMVILSCSYFYSYWMSSKHLSADLRSTQRVFSMI